MQSTKITIQEIIDRSVPHLIEGRRTVIETDRFILSIVGGGRGLYGDFKEDFEVAIMDRNTKEFVTQMFEPEATGDVMGYVPADKVVEIANYFIEKNFSKLD